MIFLAEPQRGDILVATFVAWSKPRRGDILTKKNHEGLIHEEK
jgi:hypothetical protein